MLHKVLDILWFIGGIGYRNWNENSDATKKLRIFMLKGYIGTMPTVLLHCFKGNDARSLLINDAKADGFQVTIPFLKNPHAFEITGNDAQLDAFIKKVSKDVAVFYDHDDARAMKGNFRTHVKIAKDSPKANSFAAGPVNNGNTATVMSRFYNFPSQNGIPPTIAVISLGGTYLTSDLTYYWQNVLGLKQLPTVTYVAVDGATNKPNQVIQPGDGSDENTLDIEIIGGICPGCKIVVYFAPNTNKGFYDGIATAISDTKNKPSIISISWGAPESAFDISSLKAYNQLFKSATQPVCVASGDNGSDDGVGDNKVHVDFPCSSRNVVACGGTSIQTAIESTWSWNSSYQWGTGGGISSYFSTPPYQTTLGSIVQGKRGVPDIAMNADPLSGWTIYYSRHLYVSQFGGTSCVAPMMAGLLGLMNLKYPTLFNNYLYQAYAKMKTCVKDITTGTNDSLKGSTGKYDAGKGYDLCTGLGSVNGTVLFQTLRTILSS